MGNSFVLKNANIIDTEKNCIRNCDILISDGKIEKIGKLENEGINLKGKFVSAGFFDAHVHIESSMVTPIEFAKAVIINGTTSVIADPHEIVNVGGAKAFDMFLDMAKDALINIYSVVPSSVPAASFDTNGPGEFLASDMEKYVNLDAVVGLGEVMCINDVLKHNKTIMDKIALFKSKTIDGHTTGLDENSLEEYVKCGMQNDHECSNFEEAKSRYDCGMNVYIREGSTGRNLEDIVVGIVKEKLSTDKFAFCTDDKHLATIAKEGHISYSIKKAIKLGIRPIDAIKMATANPAKFYNINDRGLIKEGYFADLVVFDGFDKFNIKMVIKDGKIIKDLKGKIHFDNESFNKDYKEFDNLIKYEEISYESFVLPNKDEFYGIELIPNQHLQKKVKVYKEELNDYNFVAVVDRYGKNGNIVTGILKNYGLKKGAIATSISHDSHNVIVAGKNFADMALAVNYLKLIGGGCVIAEGGKIRNTISLKVGGLMSKESYEKVTKETKAFCKTAKKFGVKDGIDPFVLSLVTLPVIYENRLLDRGLFDVNDFEFIK